jgi:peptide/nickel transport system permease protein
VSAQATTMPKYSEFRRFRRVFLGRKVVIVGLVILVFVAIMAIFAPLIAPYDPNQDSLGEYLSKPSLQHPLGTDKFGRDTLTRIIFGTRTSLLVASVALVIASSIGMTIGVLAGYFGGIVYAVLMRFTDAVMAIPMMLLAISVAVLFGSGIGSAVMAVGLSMTPIYARLMCSQVLVVKQLDYIRAARVNGQSNFYIILQHIVPNCFPALIVLVTMHIGLAILTEAGLSFLGVGIQPPTADWGAMVSDGYRYITTEPTLALAPGVAIILTTFAFNMVGDGLRDALDPKLRGSI